ncbi:MAG: dienelactone hydrolase family protein [Microbacteriaceae bacterium]
MRSAEIVVEDVVITEAIEGMSPGLYGALARPAGDGPWPAVVLVHEAFGIDEVMRRQVIRMARAGYLVLMPDLFAAGGSRRCLRATFRALSDGHGRAFDDIEAARRQLLSRDDCTGRIGVLGFCMGGGFALVAAARGFDVSSVNYGMLPTNLDAVLGSACPIVASYGGRDRYLRGSAAKLDAAADRAGLSHDVKEYADAGHSFLNDAPNGPAAMRPLMELVIGAGPEPESAADAWRRIEKFFAANLADPKL